MATHLQPGDEAPFFKGFNQHGQEISLRDFKGKKVVLYFYPKDDTPTCTVQACNLRDHFTGLSEKGYEVVGISPNNVESHLKFANKFSLPFTLVADADHTIIDAYGVWGEKNLYGRKYMGLHRTTFVINGKGLIEKIFKKPRSKVHAAEILK